VLTRKKIFEKEFANVLFFKKRDISSKSMPLHDRSKRLACERGAAENDDELLELFFEKGIE